MDGDLDNYIIVVVPEGNRAEEIDTAEKRTLEMIARGGRLVVCFSEIYWAYPGCGIQPSRLLAHHRVRIAFLKAHPDVSMGFMSYVNSVPILDSGTAHPESRLVIGAFCSIAVGVRIMLTNGGHGKDWGTTFPFQAVTPSITSADPLFEQKMGVTIGSDVWVGREATILPGVHIGHGAIIGAASVVSRDVEPYSITAGNPARHRRYRFPERERAALLQACWWDWSWEEIQQVIPLLCTSDIGDFLRYAAARPGVAQSGALAGFGKP
jgi:chloramphenicol O-acetyltransferase type B